jgi:hypothetical protein
MRKATTLLLLLLSLTSFAKIRTDIFVMGVPQNPTWYYAFAGEDFNKKFGLNYGDTILLRPGPAGENYYNNIDLGLAASEGITLIVQQDLKTPLLIGYIELGGKCKDWKIRGETNFLKYGIKFWNKDRFGLSLSCVGEFEASGLEMDGTAMGVQWIATDQETYAANYMNGYFHNIFIHNTSDEAMYFGWSHIQTILMALRIDSIKIRNAGCDGIQTRWTTRTEITNCDLDSIGMRNRYGHDHGILLGDNIDGAVVRNNVLKHVQGIGIWADGWGTVDIECNSIQAVNWGMMTRNIAVLNGVNTDPQNIGYVHYTLKNNTIIPGNGVTMESYFDGQGKTATIEAYNNQCPDKFNLASGITFLHNNNTLTTIPQCPSNIPVPLPVQLESFTAVKKGRAVLIQWKASESAFDHYELQKSTNGISYTLNARVAGGQTNYLVYDYFPSEVNYYRLKMIDSDGSYYYSKVVVVNMSKSNKVRSIYNLAGADMGTDAGKLKKGFYVVVYEDGSKEYLSK